MIEDALLQLTAPPRTSRKSEMCTLLLVALVTVIVTCALNFAGVYFWVVNFEHDMKYLSVFHVFEFIITFVGMIFLAFGIVTSSISLIAVFIATLSVTSISRILCIVFSFGFIAFDEQRCFKTFYASIHRDFGRSIEPEDRVLAEILCRREVCMPLLIINTVLLIFQIASIVSAGRYTKSLRYEQETKLRQLLEETAFSSLSLSLEDEYRDEDSERYNSVDSTSSRKVPSPSSKSCEDNDANGNVTPKSATTVDEIVQSMTGSTTPSVKSSSSLSWRPSWVTQFSSDGTSNPSFEFNT